MRFSLVITGIPVDQFNDESVQLVRQIKDFQDLANGKTDYTQQFVIPSTPTNDPIFQNYFDENSVFSGWNAFKKLDAQIFIHSLPVFTGCVELTGVEFKNGLPRQYNLVFYGQAKNAMADWGERTLQEIDWDDFEHTVTYSNVISSWTGGLLSGSILYPVVDWYKGMQYCRTPTVLNNMYGGGMALNGGFLVNDLRPAIKFKDMIEACFTDIGYTLGGSLLDRDEFDELYCCPMGTSGPIQNTTNVNAKFKAIISGSATFGKHTMNNPLKINFTTTVSNPSGAWNLTTDTYTTYLQGTYKFKVSGVITNNLSGFGFYLIVDNQYLKYSGLTLGNVAFEEEFIVSLNTNQKVWVYLLSDDGGDITDLAFELVEVPFGIESSVLNMADTMPQMKVSDFMNGVLKAFNAVLIPVNETGFELHNIDDYYALGATKNWTQYIDITNIKHERTTIPRIIEMRHKESEDVAWMNFQSTFNRPFGEVKASPDVDFASDELIIETPFNVLVPSIIREVNDKGQYVGNTDLQIPVMLDNDMKAVKNDLILFYYVEMKNTSFTYDINQTTQYAYPLISSYSDFPTAETSFSLAFGLETTIQGDMATKTMFTQYWQKYLSRLFSTKSRIVYFSAILPVGEWLNLKMNDTIAVSSNYYKIQSIQYDMLNERAELELITYPEVDILKIASNGLTPEWTNGTTTPEGTTLLNGDIVGRAITNAIPLVGGGLSTATLGKVEYLDSNTSWHQGSLNELVKRKRIKTAQGIDQSITTTSDGSYVVVPLTTEYQTGDTNDLVFSSATDSITPLYGGQFRVTVNVSYSHQHQHDLIIAILVGGEATFAKAVISDKDSSTSITMTADIPLSAPIQIGLSDTGGDTETVLFKIATLMVEHL